MKYAAQFVILCLITACGEQAARSSNEKSNPVISDIIDITDIHHRNDTKYLHISLKCSHTVQERYSKFKTSSILAYLYIDSDSDKSTGAIRMDDSGSEEMIGADIKIWVPIGVYTKYENSIPTEGSDVSYDIHIWDDKKKEFGPSLRSESSDDPDSLIQEVADGVDLSLPLSVLGKSKGSRFTLISVPWSSKSKTTRTVIEID